MCDNVAAAAAAAAFDGVRTVEDDAAHRAASQPSRVILLSLRAHQNSNLPPSASLSDAPSLCISLYLCLLSLFSRSVVISALVLSLASPPATAAAGRASCHSSEGQWSGQLSPGTHHLHTMPSQPPPSHII